MSASASLDQKVKQAVLDVLRELNIEPPTLLPFDQTSTLEPFLLECLEEVRRRNYISPPVEEKHIRIGATVGHYVWLLPSLVPHKLALLASLLMGLYYCIDDGCFAPQSLAEHAGRLVSGQVQLERGLGHAAALLEEVAGMYESVVGDLLRMAHQAYVMGNYLEGRMAGEGKTSLLTVGQWEVNKNAPAFPSVMKTITSAATALYLLSFPPAVPFTSYLQTLPDGIAIHDNTADIMSYYKESLVGEFNRVEQIAQLHGLSGPDMLAELVQSTIACHERVVRALGASDPTRALRLVECHEQAVRGFVVFQALHPRYKLRDFGVFSF
ncbi:hypothetical protein B0H17DRAFT_1264581 [Mycena rosella]|uniref:Terpenoid synthase n=1 Tax=Mycena rosella TaxID=1033263 RepID=A0AAD7MB28_MYCRO|nr:hypothetical protein B0H17DRAFT_1264581 [Mycena rosella]